MTKTPENQHPLVRLLNRIIGDRNPSLVLNAIFIPIFGILGLIVSGGIGFYMFSIFYKIIALAVFLGLGWVCATLVLVYFVDDSKTPHLPPKPGREKTVKKNGRYS